MKPTASQLVTNLVIATDRRVYHVELRSLDATYMASVSWTYPKEELAFRTAAVKSRAPGRAAAADGIRPEALHFGYRILGDQPPWQPVRAFDDGRRVFIQFPPGTAEAPPLFLIGPEGEVALVNYRVSSRRSWTNTAPGSNPNQPSGLTTTGRANGSVI